MRTPPYLSPTSVSMFYRNRDEFYLRYCAENSPPRMPQTQPMSIGSAFDAHIKSYLSKVLFDEIPDGFALQDIFNTQVEPRNREWAWEESQYVFDCYKKSGAIADLMSEIKIATSKPRMEFTVQKEINGIPLLGKPDLFFPIPGQNFLLDWKVNGYCSKSATSPCKGFKCIRDGWDSSRAPASRGCNNPHKDAVIMMHNGVMINVAQYLEEVNESWAEQLTIYGWIMGNNMDEEILVGIDQLVFKPDYPNRPLMRVAQHRTRISVDFQHQLFDKIQVVWDALQTGHVFTELSEKESEAKQLALDEYYRAFEGDQNDPKERWFNEHFRGEDNYRG